MPYQLYRFDDPLKGYVLQGTGDHSGTSEHVGYHEMGQMSADIDKLTAYLDYRFMRAHGERIARETEVEPC